MRHVWQPKYFRTTIHFGFKGKTWLALMFVFFPICLRLILVSILSTLYRLLPSSLRFHNPDEDFVKTVPPKYTDELKKRTERYSAVVISAVVLPSLLTDHFAVICSVTWPLNGSEASRPLCFCHVNAPS